MMRNMYILSMALAIALLPTPFAWGADTPLYIDGVLTIPTVSTPEQVGKYQDVTFKLNEQGLWQLSSLKGIGIVIGESEIQLVPIASVDVVKANAFPTQVFLRVTGGLGGCFSNTLGQINQRLENNRFDVVITASNYVYAPVPGVCPAISRSFVKTIPLAVYGLSAGTYSYNVNGTTGTFELVADNKYPGDY